jgi:aminomethyltransferase
MPLSYPSGTLEEHRRCRNDAVAFDVSHLGTVRVEGDGARALLQRTLTNDLDKIEAGRAQYTHLLGENGSVLDDIIVWWIDETRFDVMPNASNTDRVVAALSGESVSAVDATSERAIVAVQGPNARKYAEAVSPQAAAIGRFRVGEFEFMGMTCLVAGTGYTGEDGIECAVPRAVAEPFWDAVVASGAQPAGLGARDTLRLEAGLPLHGHELGEGISPLQAGLGWVVGWDKETFVGSEALLAEREAGVTRKLVGLKVEGRRPPRAGQQVIEGGDVIGEVTSGNFSPILECGIALAFCRPDIESEAVVEIDQRGTRVAATVVKTPFVNRG